MVFSSVHTHTHTHTHTLTHTHIYIYTKAEYDKYLADGQIEILKAGAMTAWCGPHYHTGVQSGIHTRTRDSKPAGRAVIFCSFVPEKVHTACQENRGFTSEDPLHFRGEQCLTAQYLEEWCEDMYDDHGVGLGSSDDEMDAKHIGDPDQGAVYCYYCDGRDNAECFICQRVVCMNCAAHSWPMMDINKIESRGVVCKLKNCIIKYDEGRPEAVVQDLDRLLETPTRDVDADNKVRSRTMKSNKRNGLSDPTTNGPSQDHPGETAIDELTNDQVTNNTTENKGINIYQ